MNQAEEKILELFTFKTEKLGDIARLADMTEADTLHALRRRGLVMSPHVDEDPDETLWRKV